MIEVKNLVKSFGSRRVLADIDLQVETGTFLTLVGPNGAGKTTLLRILALLSRPTSGRLRFAGLDPDRQSEAIRRRIGFLSHRTLLYEDLTVAQNLRFYAQMYRIADPGPRITALLAQVGLEHRLDDVVRTLSRGLQQRLAVTRTVLHGPDLLLLDEPYTGLDPGAAQAVTELLHRLTGGGTTVLLTTHNLERGLAAGNRIAVLVQGQIAHDAAREDVDGASFAATYRRLTRQG